jgi:membrane protein involved in colicin uptake
MILKRRMVSWLAAILVVGGTIALAQDATTMPTSDDVKIASARVKVPSPYSLLPDLSDEQQSKIRDIHAEILDEQKMLKQKERDEIEAVLSEDQKKELEDLEVKAALEKKADEAQRREKEEQEKIDSLKDKAGGSAATQPSGGQ